MSTNDLQQYAFFTVVGAVALLALWYIFIKAPQARATELAPWAQKRGLRFTPPRSLGSHTTGVEVTVLEGPVNGVNMRLESARLVNSRRAGINGHCQIETRAAMPAPVDFTLILEHGPSLSAPDAVWTGDPAFDGRVRSRSDNPAAARAWLATAARPTLAAVLADSAPVTIRYAHGNLTLRTESPIWNEPQLDRALGAVAACAYARLS